MRPDAHPPRWIPLAFLAVFVLNLAMAPPPFSDREAAIVARAQGLARGTADASGRVMPLIVHHDGERWHQPLAVYPAALLMRAGLPSRMAVRLPAMFAAAISALLTYALGLRLFQPGRIGALALLLLVTAPAWTAFGTAGGGDAFMVAAILGWLTAVCGWRERPPARAVVAGGFLLGLSAWTQPAGVLAVPLFLAVGGAMLIESQRPLRVLALAALGSAIPIVACGIWLARHPDAYADTFGRWAIHAAHVRDPWQGLMAVTTWDVMARRAGEYWAYLSPTFLFDGGAMFDVPLIAFVAAGFWAALDGGRRAIVLAVAFLATPIVAVLLDAPREVGLVLMMAPLGALLAALGVEWILARRGGRAIVFVLLVVIFGSRAVAAISG